MYVDQIWVAVFLILLLSKSSTGEVKEGGISEASPNMMESAAGVLLSTHLDATFLSPLMLALLISLLPLRSLLP